MPVEGVDFCGKNENFFYIRIILFAQDVSNQLLRGLSLAVPVNNRRHPLHAAVHPSPRHVLNTVADLRRGSHNN